MPSIHPFDEAAEEVVRWMTDEPAWYADALKGGHDAPFRANATEAQKLDFYIRQVFAQNRDGSINYDQANTSGRDALIKRLGINGYTQVMAAVLGERRRNGADSEQEMPARYTTPAPPLGSGVGEEAY